MIVPFLNIFVSAKGTAIFTEATVLNLTQQQRAIHDAFHTNIIQKLHSGQPLQMQQLQQYKLLTKEDITGQGEFRFAPILVSSNRERIKCITFTTRLPYLHALSR